MRLRRLALAEAVVGWTSAHVASADDRPLKEAYYGETHVHTAWSLDALPRATA
jgi:hypothetical protein